MCLPVLERVSHPPSTTLNDIARQLEPHFPTMFRQELLSVVIHKYNFPLVLSF